MAEARAFSAVCGGVRVISIYAPNGRVVGSEFFQAKLVWFDRLARWFVEKRFQRPKAIVLGGEFNVAPADADVWDPAGRTWRNPRRSRRTSGGPSSASRLGSGGLGLERCTPSPSATRGGITERACSRRTTACASITCWSPTPSLGHVKSGQRSIGRRAKESQSRPITLRS